MAPTLRIESSACDKCQAAVKAYHFADRESGAAAYLRRVSEQGGGHKQKRGA